jgi:hypothetical protein
MLKMQMTIRHGFGIYMNLSVIIRLLTAGKCFNETGLQSMLL